MTERVAPFQSKGSFGTRHFDKYVWYVPIPEYSSSDAAHRELAKLGAQAEQVAGGVDLPADLDFKSVRRRVRDALDVAGISNKIEQRVGELLH